MFVFEGFLKMRVSRLPSSSLVIKTSKKAMDFSSSISLVNWTLGWTELRQSLNAAAGPGGSSSFVVSVLLLLLLLLLLLARGRRPVRRGGSMIVQKMSSM